MDFFYNLNKKMAELSAKTEQEQIAESKRADAIAKSPLTKALNESTGDYSAKKARAGKDIGKPGKMFGKIAKSAGERYGSKERGEKVAGAVLAKLRAKESVEKTDDHKETKLIRDLRAQGLSDKEIVRKMKELKYGTTKTVAKEGDMDESALQAYLGKKKYGEKGMKALQQAGREHAGKAKMDQIRAKHDKMDESVCNECGMYESKCKCNEGNAFTAALKATPKGEKFKLGDKTFTDTSDLEEGFKELDAWMKSREKEKGTDKFDKKERTLPGGMKATTYTRKHDDEEDSDDEVKSKDDKPKKKGRPTGTGRKIGAKGPSGKSKLMKKDAIKEMDIALVDKGEYDREGEMAKQQIHTIMRAAKNLHRMLGDDDNLPEWVQKKITLATNYIDSVTDYMTSQRAEAGAEAPIAEKAVSKQQQKFMGMAHAMQKGERIPGASKELKKVARTMKPKDVEDFAKTKHAGLPKKVKEEGKPDFLDLDKDGNKAEPMKQAAKQAKSKNKDEKVDETTTSGSVATVQNAAPKASKGMQFGKGVYESINNNIEKIINESVTVEASMEECGDGMGQSITVQADGEDAAKLLMLLKLAGLGDKTLDENSPDWPTDTETLDADPNLRTYSGGLNGPKSTGQSTTVGGGIPNYQARRQVSMEEGVELERSLFKLYKEFK